jgi:hypothetical protein
MFHMNGSNDAPSTSEPIVEIVFSVVNPSVGR